MKKQYSNIDYMKLLFALAIPFLHISGGGTVTNIIAQYIARLGVPFFFCVSGFLIATQMNEQNDIQTVTNKQLWHVGKLFVLWNVLYFPFVFYSEWKNRGLLLGGIHYIREVLFRAPAYLWYISALWVGIWLLQKLYYNKAIVPVAICLYLIGVLGGSYRDVFLKESMLLNLYETIFITTRNGVFFAFPMICLGAKIAKWLQMRRYEPKMNIVLPLSIVAYVLFCIEVYTVRRHVAISTDTSMLWTIPLTIGALVTLLAIYTGKPSADALQC